jgi:hypothetical protein
VSLKGRLRGLDARVHWLETNGDFLRLQKKVKLLRWAQIFADRVATDPAWAEKTKKEMPAFFAIMWQLSAGVRKAAAPPPPPPSPRPAVVPERPPPSEPTPEPAPAVLPILRDAAVPAPQDESRAGPEANPQPALPPPEERRVAAVRKPPVAPPAPDMEIRPVRWRPRGEPDDYEERPGTNGRCITEYDPLRGEYDDDE